MSVDSVARDQVRGSELSDAEQASLIDAKVVVVFATHNGGRVLATMLEGYAAMSAPRRPWAMIAVDNASTDETGTILRSFQSRLPLIVLHEPAPGKNAALNHVLDIIPLGAELYIFTDDDAVPEANFLQKWEDVIENKPDIELFGGVVRPRFQVAPPSWLPRYSRYFGELYAQIDRPSGEIAPQGIFGPNMAVRGSVLSAGHRFNDKIGPNSTNADYPMGSETEFCVRVSAIRGGLAWFTSGPAVHHIVRPHQTTQEFIARRAYRHGRGVAMRQALAEERPRSSRALLKAAVMQRLLWLAMRMPLGTTLWDYHWRRGYNGGLAENRAAFPSNGSHGRSAGWSLTRILQNSP